MLANTASAHFGAKPQSRCLAACSADPERHRFLLGSCSLREDNEVQLLELNEETNQVSSVALFPHPGQVWSLSPSPRNPALLFTACEAAGGPAELILWRMPDECLSSEADSVDASLTNAALAHVSSVPSSPATSVLWQTTQGSAGTETIVAVGPRRAQVLDVSGGAVSAVSSLEATTPSGFVGGAWDPHSGCSLSMVGGRDVHGWDVRASNETFRISDAHKFHVRDVDYNPNKPSFIVTAGNDRLVKFWDLRRPAEPVRMLAGHNHWVWTARYNRFHDQLLLSAGTDSLVSLWRVSSISSAPLLELEAEASTASDTGDGRIRSFDEHEESVYAVAWSASDAWVFASLSYDGRVVVNHVPSTEKYKILL